MQIIQERELIESVQYQLFFERTNAKGSGFSFNCDKNGNVNVEELCEDAKKNYLFCQSKEIDVQDPYVQTWKHSYRQPAIGKCPCGQEVILDSFTNGCECGRDYNMSGHLLNPRCFWGEDTGEHLSDILRIK